MRNYGGGAGRFRVVGGLSRLGFLGFGKAGFVKASWWGDWRHVFGIWGWTLEFFSLFFLYFIPGLAICKS